MKKKKAEPHGGHSHTRLRHVNMGPCAMWRFMPAKRKHHPHALKYTVHRKRHSTQRHMCAAILRLVAGPARSAGADRVLRLRQSHSWSHTRTARTAPVRYRQAPVTDRLVRVTGYRLQRTRRGPSSSVSHAADQLPLTPRPLLHACLISVQLLA